MPTSTNLPNSAPGISLKSLFLKAKTPSLRNLIGQSILDSIQFFDKNLLSEDRLGELAIRLIDPFEALRDAQMRNCILRMLPLPKAKELGARLGVSFGRNFYEDLCNEAANKASLSVLCSFFGVVRDIHAPMNLSPDVRKVGADYSIFDHQRSVADRVMKMLKEYPRKVVLHMPTGSGKTRTAMHIIASHLSQQEPTVVCWLAQSAELLEQAASEFENAWRYLGNREVDLIRYWGNRTPNILEIRDGIVVAGLGKMSSLDKRNLSILPRFADRVSLTVIDEAHQAIAPTYASILALLHSKRPSNALLGLTATPGRSWSDVEEDRKLSEFFNGCKASLEIAGYDDPISFLIDKKYLAQPKFETLNSDVGFDLNEDDIKELSSATEIPQYILSQVGLDSQRNLKILSTVKILLKRHMRVILFAPSVESAKLIDAVLSLQKFESYLITAQSTKFQRERLVRRFRSDERKPMVMVNYGVLTTGFDAPATSAALIARPTKSLVLYSQMVGRATRGTRVGGNELAEIVTVVDPQLPGFGSIVEAFKNWEDVWNE